MASDRKIVWSESEDEFLRLLAEDKGKNTWRAIAKEFGNRFPERRRNSQQCRYRYMNHLHSGLSKRSLTSGEKELIFKLHRVFSNRWKLIAEFLPGRTQNRIKGFFYSAIKKARKNFSQDKGSGKICNRTIKSLVRDRNATVLLKMKEEEENGWDLLILDCIQIVNSYIEEWF